MIINIFQFLIGAFFLYYGAEFLIKGSQAIANKFNISHIVIGITLVAFGTSLPELVVSILANLKGEPGMVIGNVMGSNVANIGLVLGTTAILSPIYFPFAKIRYDLYFLVGITFLPLGFIFMGDLVFWQGMILILILIIYCTYLLKNNKLDDENNKVIINNNKSLLMVQIIIGIIGLSVGATFFVEGAKGIALALGISSLVIGMSIVALGTSLPELATSLSAAKHGNTGIVMGNVIGSNIMNIVLVLGISVLFRNIPVDFSEIIVQGFFMVILIMGLLLLLKRSDGLTKLSGIIFVGIYILFLYFNFQSI